MINSYTNYVEPQVRRTYSTPVRRLVFNNTRRAESGFQQYREESIPEPEESDILGTEEKKNGDSMWSLNNLLDGILLIKKIENF
jgi:hypothetical protein